MGEETFRVAGTFRVAAANREVETFPGEASACLGENWEASCGEAASFEESRREARSREGAFRAAFRTPAGAVASAAAAVAAVEAVEIVEAPMIAADRRRVCEAEPRIRPVQEPELRARSASPIECLGCVRDRNRRAVRAREPPFRSSTPATARAYLERLWQWEEQMHSRHLKETGPEEGPMCQALAEAIHLRLEAHLLFFECWKVNQAKKR